MECVRMLLTLICVLVLFTTASRIPRQGWAVDDDGCRTPDRGVGSCIRISECQTMLDFLSTKSTFSQTEKNALFRYRCGAYREEPKVCCPNRPINLAWGVECSINGEGSGVCVDIKECKILINFITQNKLTDLIKQTLRKYRCEGSRNLEVCCPSKLPNILLLNTTTPDRAGGSEHRNAKLLPTQCGEIYNGEKITNGNVTSLFEFPWAAVLKYDKEVNAWGCGGSLINERYVLTAAHCIRSNHKLTTVRLGEYNFTSDRDCIPGLQLECAELPQDFEVSADDVIVHPGYNAKTYHDDIALIRLRKPANMSVFSVSPVCLPLTTAQRTENFANYTVIGWGATETGYSSPVLLKVNVPKVNNVDCAPNYQGKTILTDKQLCAGGKNEQDSCAGDSGGPLMADVREDFSYKTVQYGIVSLGPRICGKEGFPAVYTRVDKYVDWILDTIKA